MHYFLVLFSLVLVATIMQYSVSHYPAKLLLKRNTKIRCVILNPLNRNKYIPRNQIPNRVIKRNYIRKCLVVKILYVNLIQIIIITKDIIYLPLNLPLRFDNLRYTIFVFLLII